MAFIVPAVAAFASVGGFTGGLAAVGAAMGTLSGFATIAGGVLASIGALTGSKDLMKVGSLLGIGGAIANIAGSASGAAAGEAAASVTDPMGAFGAAETGAGSLTSATTAPTLGEGLSTGALEGIGADAATQSATQTAGAEAAQAAAADAFGNVGSELSAAQGPILGRVSETASNIGQSLSGAGQSLGSGAAGLDGSISLASANQIGSGIGATGAGSGAPAIDAWGAGKTSDQIGGLLKSSLDKTSNLVGGIGKSIEKNPEVWKLGSGILQGMYGPQAEQADLLKKQQEMQNSILMRRLRNLNNPVALGNIGV